MTGTSHMDAKAAIFFMEDHMTGLVVKPGETFDVTHHFIHQGENTSDQSHRPLYRLCTLQTPGIQAQGSAVEAPGPSDPFAPPVIFPSGTFVRFELNQALYLKRAFWALFILYGDTHEQSVIWGLITQKLMWMIGDKILIHSIAEGKHNSTLSALVEKVQIIVTPWKCEEEEFRTCFLQLVNLLVENNKLDNSVETVLNKWLVALEFVGYKFPSLNSAEMETCRTNHVVYNPVSHPQTGTTQKAHSKMPVLNVEAIQRTYEETCLRQAGIRNPTIQFAEPWIQFREILLLVVFNNPHYESIPYIETLYRPFFPNMMHCAAGFPDFTHPPLNNFYFSFYSYESKIKGLFDGVLSHECHVAAIQIQIPVKGILVIHDDILLAIHTMVHFKLDQAWNLPLDKLFMADITTMKECNGTVCDKKLEWNWWTNRQPMLNAVRRFDREQNTSSVVHNCFRNWLQRNEGPNRMVAGFSDIHYIPSKFFRNFSEILSAYLEEKVWFLQAVPSTIQCTEGFANIQALNGKLVWDESRYSPWETFHMGKFTGYNFLHPTKWSSLAKISERQPQIVDLFCNKVLPWLHDREGKLPP